MRVLLVYLLLCLCATLVQAEYISVRLMGLGSDFAHIVEDEKTDVLFNPARLVIWDDNLLSLQFDDSDREITALGLFPHVRSRVGGGWLLRASHDRDYHVYPAYESFRASGTNIYVNKSFRDREHYRRDYSIRLLSAYVLSSRASIGLSYAFEPRFKSVTYHHHYINRRWSVTTVDTSRDEQNSHESDEGSRDVHRLRLGFVLSDGGEDWEFLGEYRVTARDSISSLVRASQYAHLSVYSDTNYYDDTTYYHRLRRSERQNREAEVRNFVVDSKSLGLGCNYRRRLGDTKLNIHTLFGLTSEQLPEERSTSYDEHYYSLDLRIIDGDTTIYETRRDSEYRTEHRITGDAEAIFGIAGVGVERPFLDGRLLVLGGTILNLERRTEQRSRQIRVFREETLSTSYTEVSETKYLDLRCAVPLGAEYLIHQKAMIRFGVTVAGTYGETEMDGRKLYRESMQVYESFGASLRPLPELSCEIYTLAPTSIRSWILELSLKF